MRLSPPEIARQRNRQPSASQAPSLARKNRTFAQCYLLVIICLAGLPSRATAQIGNALPRETYYLAKRDYYAGQFKSAERGFLRSLKSGLRIGNKRWIDSICSYTMLGELYYRQGNLAGALQSHEAALEIFLANQNWMNRLRYPPIGASNDRVQTRITWGTRPTAMGNYPDSMSSQEGTFDLQTSFQVGGPVNPAHMRSVDAVEVARCLAVSLRRRALLLGHSTSVSPMSAKLSNAVSRTNPPATHWANAWVEVLFGMAQLNEGLRKESVAHLAAGVVAGNFDHPLTGIALLEIGRYHLQKGEYPVAVNHLHQASLAAARFRQADVVEEAIDLMTDAFLANEGRGIYPPIAAVIPYAQREDFYRLTMSVQLASAEIAYYANEHAQAATWLAQMRAVMSRTDQFPTALGAKLNYVDALTKYRVGERTAAWKLLQVAVANRQAASLRRFHLATVESLRSAGRRLIGPRELEILYSRLLREPTDQDWRTEPLETISWTLLDQTPSMSNWFELLVDRKEYEKAVAVAEQLKRHRFYRSLPMGGRLLSLRWLFDGDSTLLGKRFAKVQVDLRRSYPQMEQLSRTSTRIQAELAQLPLLPSDDQQRVQQRALFEELISISDKQENTIGEIALRREPGPLVFPPQPSHSAIQNALEPNQALLMFVTTAKGWHVWFLRTDVDEYWPIRAPKAVRRQISELLREIGNHKANSSITDKDLENEDWKKICRSLWKSIIGKLPSNGWDDLEELIIVPDGPMWYLPFEMLRVPADQLEGEDEEQSLLSLTRIRYAPLASMSVGDRRGHNDNSNTTVVAGELFPGESSEYAQEMLAQLKLTYPNLNVIGKEKPAASSNLTSSLLNRLVVWNDIAVRGNNAYGWSPAQYDRKSRSSQLSDWLEYPWGGTDQLILPGFHTVAERSLSNSASGHEVFLAVCGLMSTGTRTALVSRWRTGGRVPTVLVREFVSRLTQATASEAWQRATDIARSESLDADMEPRFRAGTKTPEEISADHPFFWAGYMLVDTGAKPQPVVQEPTIDEVPAVDEEPAANEKADDAGEQVSEEPDEEMPTDESPPAAPTPDSATAS